MDKETKLFGYKTQVLECVKREDYSTAQMFVDRVLTAIPTDRDAICLNMLLSVQKKNGRFQNNMPMIYPDSYTLQKVLDVLKPCELIEEVRFTIRYLSSALSIGSLFYTFDSFKKIGDKSKTNRLTMDDWFVRYDVSVFDDLLEWINGFEKNEYMDNLENAIQISSKSILRTKNEVMARKAKEATMHAIGKALMWMFIAFLVFGILVILIECLSA